MDFYDGKRVLGVGGSRGSGRALALLLARRGARVCVAARGAADLERAVAELPAVAAGPHGLAAFDTADGDAVARARDGVLAALGGLDVVVCGSGSARAAAVFDAPADDYRRMLEINYLGHVNVVRAFGPELVARRGGAICLVSSLAALMPIYGYAAYAASKAALAAFAESLRQEMKLHGVNVVVHYPPTTDTPGLVEENRTKPPAVWKIESQSGWSRIHTAESVAASIATAIERGRPQALTGFDSRLLATVLRLAPGIFRRLTDAEVRKAVAATREAS
ncbi:MAG: SDR family NAD(P)-dependent oxidoreductase [Planctomycetaceae bacterium]